jgi:hypothetical protein
LDGNNLLFWFGVVVLGNLDFVFAAVEQVAFDADGGQ